MKEAAYKRKYRKFIDFLREQILPLVKERANGEKLGVMGVYSPWELKIKVYEIEEKTGVQLSDLEKILNTLSQSGLVETFSFTNSGGREVTIVPSRNFTDVIDKHLEAVRAGGKIYSIKLFKPLYFRDKMQLIINEDWENFIEVNLLDKSWELLLAVALVEDNKSAKVVYKDEHKQLLDYLNSNKTCPIYSRTGYQLTKILVKKGGVILPGVKLDIVKK